MAPRRSGRQINYIIKLIMEVKKRPCLYAIDKPEYKDATKKNDAWKEISKVMTRDKDMLRRDWKNLRDCYRQALVTRSTKKKRMTELKPWKYENQMEFIKPYLDIASKNKPSRSVIRVLQLSRPSCAVPASTSASAASASSRSQSPETTTVKEEMNDDTEVHPTLFGLSTFPERRLPRPSTSGMITMGCCADIAPPPPTPPIFPRVVHRPITVRLSDRQGTVRNSVTTCDLELFFSSMYESAKILPRIYQNKIKKDLMESIHLAEEEWGRNSRIYDQTSRVYNPGPPLSEEYLNSGSGSAYYRNSTYRLSTRSTNSSFLRVNPPEHINSISNNAYIINSSSNATITTDSTTTNTTTTTGSHIAYD